MKKPNRTETEKKTGKKTEPKPSQTEKTKPKSGKTKPKPSQTGFFPKKTESKPVGLTRFLFF